MKVREVLKKEEGQYVELGIFVNKSGRHTLNYEYLTELEDFLSDNGVNASYWYFNGHLDVDEEILNIDVDYWHLLNEEEYNNQCLCNSSEKVDFLDLYENKEAKILIIIAEIPKQYIYDVEYKYCYGITDNSTQDDKTELVEDIVAGNDDEAFQNARDYFIDVLREYDNMESLKREIVEMNGDYDEIKIVPSNDYNIEIIVDGKVFVTYYCPEIKLKGILEED